MPPIASCCRSGEIVIGRKCSKDAIPLAVGPSRRLQFSIEGSARLAYDNKTWLVPGVPEAPDENAAIEAAEQFAESLKARMEIKSKARTKARLDHNARPQT